MAMKADPPRAITAAEGRRFALTLAVAFGLLGALLHWRGLVMTGLVLAGVAAAFLLGAALAPTRLGPVQRAWMGFALLLSRVTTPVFMGIVYFLVVTPIGLVMRVLGKNPMRPRTGRTSYWVPRSETGGRGGMQNQF